MSSSQEMLSMDIHIHVTMKIGAITIHTCFFFGITMKSHDTIDNTN